ncbi:hypothetical protein T01_6467 [Trichinella spiralis]|uniref:Uncharacterized protein n=1 Tax=Trichinella spiralis TaxID=6334 RepID=A0A0V1BVZ0_TRISP|nr:hypothetical protein T01_6467 [Trichinella spiralis]
MNNLIKKPLMNYAMQKLEYNTVEELVFEFNAILRPDDYLFNNRAVVVEVKTSFTLVDDE